MKEAFEKIKERFGKKIKPLHNANWNAAFEEAIEIVNQVAEETTMGKVSDGYHTFDELYHHRAVLFAVICNTHKELAWKSKLHDTGDMYDGMFIVGIETPEGQATYHYDINPYWDMFNVKELSKAPKWDGHTPDEAIRRIGLLDSNDGWIPCSERLPTRNKYYDITYCTRTGMHTSQAFFNTDDNSWYWEPGIMICTDKVLAWVDSIKRKPYQPKGE